ncbi:MAG: hypothetical protein AAF560_16595 [Acidobacteriota bacterium]
MRNKKLLMGAWIAASLVLSAPAIQATDLLAKDDLVVVRFNQSNDQTFIDFNDLLENDTGATIDDIWISEEPLHRDTDHSGTVGTSYVFTPKTSFWALGSDQLTYTLTVQGETSTATVFLFAHLPTTSPMINEEFEPGIPPSYLPRSYGANTVGVSTADPISGAGSLKVDIIDALDGDAYISVPYAPGSGDDDDEDELGGCYRAGGGRLVGDQTDAWIVVLQGPQLDPEQAPVRLLLRSDGALVAEVQGHAGVESSEPIYPTNSVVHFKLLWSYRGGELKALLRVDGMAVETPKVYRFNLNIDTAHLGGILAPGAGPFEIDLDRLTGIGVREKSVKERVFFEGFESGALAGWNHVYGPGIEVDADSAITGGRGLEAAVLPQSASFISRASPAANNAMTLRFKVDTRLLNLTAGRLISPVGLGSDDDALFGVTDFAVSLVGSTTGPPRAGLSSYYTGSIRFGDWTPVSGEHVFEIQYRRSDPGAHNGLLRLWIDGVVATTQDNLPSEGDELRGTQGLTWLQIGSKGYNPEFVDGTLAFDDVSLTRIE